MNCVHAVPDLTQFSKRPAEAPNPKIQTPKQIPNTNNQKQVRHTLFGAWVLGFGISDRRWRSAECLPGRGLRERIAVFSPGEMAILAIKFLRENFQCEKNARDSRRNEFPGQLRIFDPGRLALRATNRGADLRIARFALQP